jgi:hypothetical protein
MEISGCTVPPAALSVQKNPWLFFICTPASLDLVMRRKISTSLGNDILGAHVVAEPILCKGGSGGHVDRMAKYKIMIKKKGLRIKPTYKIKTYTYML